MQNQVEVLQLNSWGASCYRIKQFNILVSSLYWQKFIKFLSINLVVSTNTNNVKFTSLYTV